MFTEVVLVTDKNIYILTKPVKLNLNIYIVHSPIINVVVVLILVVPIRDIVQKEQPFSIL
jgi:hypothetical protein